ncbi:Ribosomal protein L15 (RplO) (PDB:1VS6) [Commensalibacter communis]|uniref:Large ribosomal subunit protein uL15 n=1 Tax=Commensalibacter communis TaxID=2972786 RepID=A0A9W4TL60_9PROT|nr:50S ribosomal protein L15 [Commensalibacter communis]CAI3923470.1 Ribosomal protein L15 (RplO) (PDB:1VS6) [Commensalibacter communis]CAI3924950.1 Ribosomal protein L15 (RplO) (PDB:1VS6) [Commensalibacter communis]CAI3925045.1 Ribosomal protein L15 (RplO) (PDB:1VS6) [Commensalibacter communis]CAI3925225.1 Ribosomal protein L15 (RplO) (PDB:1VS6) [Commensalibacter communis]CAI3925906.1 Ribosomal protein L15 (RplO) (PDB:1VS6) [Commensalibacter communis]
MNLNELRDNLGSRYTKKRLGRGIGSGKGKTSGKGHKGQHARSGVAINGFEGGQLPLYRRLPKRGFKNIFRKLYAEVNLDTLSLAIDEGKLNASSVINEEALRNAGLFKGKKYAGVRLLGKGELNKVVNLEVSGASIAALEAVKKAGGSVKLLVPSRDVSADA